VIVADTGALIALIDRADRHHRALRALYEETADEWVLPWAILAEVDYLLGAHVGKAAQRAFLEDLADGALPVVWGSEEDLDAAHRLLTRYKSLDVGLVDAVVIATATRLRARAIATLDLRHFGAVKIPGDPKLFPRDL
jgi:predicted nucleic acid-binding protein